MLHDNPLTGRLECDRRDGLTRRGGDQERPESGRSTPQPTGVRWEGETYGRGWASFRLNNRNNSHTRAHSAPYTTHSARRTRLLAKSLSSLLSNSCKGVRPPLSRMSNGRRWTTSVAVSDSSACATDSITYARMDDALSRLALENRCRLSGCMDGWPLRRRPPPLPPQIGNLVTVT